ncbi:putative HTH-type transcriptional regulator YulB [Capsulimonas corticalis]|uniref:HTH-type transcriptional regulator YulB n=1 Tax=Capsulimonas corticalis TaxID=2219043 RepID=A0A402CV91_9BACT|nr:DeoR/GlpR family DNA-binding transcription regulator [Capsulimonas corticalis]BDI30324.1 putative HTH-type transcriptional regulator YulB [Capsulimonas corticalis]
MLVAERHREIVALVDKEKSVRVAGLARLFQVTEETIRRDLEKLEGEGVLLRSHGGAVSIRSGGREASYSEREVSFASEKSAIAREAVRLIEEGDTIIVDASTTAWQMTKLLPDIPLTVLTNAMQVCIELASRPRIRVICTGGSLSAPSLSFTGARAEQALAEYHVNRLFFSCTGVDLEHGLSDVNEAQATLKQKMMAIADRSYLLVDKSKFGVRALKRFGSLGDVDEVITNTGVEPATVQEMTALGVTVTAAK